jgi:hypothetical protein
MTSDCYPMDHPEIRKRIETIKKVGFKRAFALSILYLSAVFINGFLILAIINAIYPLDLASEIPILLAVAVFSIVTIADFILLYNNKITPAILTLVVIYAWILLPYEFISGNQILDKKKTPIEIKKSIFHKIYPIAG